ncbi:MAG: hypothetical protein ACYDGR_07230 [Candidatus Dormibacteria bacterium]
MPRLIGTGYSVEVPEGWVQDQGGPVMLGGQADIFLGPASGSPEDLTVRMSVNLGIYPGPRGQVTMDEVKAGGEQMTKNFGAKITGYFDQDVAGEPGLGFLYAVAYGGHALAARQVLVARTRTLYFVLMVCPGGNLKRHSGAMRAMLKSWRWQD